MNSQAVSELVTLHLKKRLRLMTSEPKPGAPIIAGDPDPDVLVAELLQLALFGANVRELAKASPSMSAAALVANASFNVARPT